jgi:hypothetical protein
VKEPPVSGMYVLHQIFIVLFKICEGVIGGWLYASNGVGSDKKEKKKLRT